MTSASIRETIRPVARSYFDDRVLPAHDWHHVRRVETLADRLVAEREDVDERVLGPAVLLHDVGRAREDAGEIDDHAAWGSHEARTILADRGVEEATIDAVCHCIRGHRYSNDVEPETVEARVLSDADNLDALGAIGVARTFSYGGERGTPIYDPDVSASEDDSAAGRTSAAHARTKLLDLPERMYTPEGRELADERVAFVERFLDRLEAEVNGRR